jgi:protein kinase A
MPALGRLLKKRTKETVDVKDSASSTTASTLDSFGNSGTSTGINPVQTTSSQTSHETLDSEPGKPSQTARVSVQQAPTSVPHDDRLTGTLRQTLVTTSDKGIARVTAVEPRQIADMEARPSGGVAISTPRVTKGKYTLTDFTLQRTLGTGSFGRVHLVQSKHNQRFYAVKVLKKAQVVKMKQVEHTNDERRMLQKVKHPFLITLWGTFQDSKNLYMVMDFVEGGELFSLLRKSQVLSNVLTCTTLSLTWLVAIPESSCKVLCCGSNTGAGLPALFQHHLSRPET